LIAFLYHYLSAYWVSLLLGPITLQYVYLFLCIQLDLLTSCHFLLGGVPYYSQFYLYLGDPKFHTPTLPLLLDAYTLRL
jgi:hypothetical protein